MENIAFVCVWVDITTFTTKDHSKICNAFHVLLISSMANLMLNPFS